MGAHANTIDNFEKKIAVFFVQTTRSKTEMSRYLKAETLPALAMVLPLSRFSARFVRPRGNMRGTTEAAAGSGETNET